MIKSFLIILIVTGVSYSYAGKVDDIQENVRINCHRQIEKDEVLRLIKKVYLTCIPGKDVELDETCKLKCQKLNTGTVVGG